MPPATRHIAVLGGGLGGLSTAYEIVSRDPNCTVTIFEMGWRLGGKCSTWRSGGNVRRVEEHGIHVFFGAYENAFNLLKRAYAKIGGNWEDAFTSRSWFTLYDEYDGQWDRWDFYYPDHPSGVKPGDRLDSQNAHVFPTLLDATSEMIQWFVESVSAFVAAHAPPIMAAPVEALRDQILALLKGQPPPALLGLAIDLLDDLFGAFLDLNVAIQNIAKFFGNDPLKDSDYRKVTVLVELGVAAAKGLLTAEMKKQSLSDLDRYDLVEWLELNAAGGKLSKVAAESALVRMTYEASFAYEGGDWHKPNFAAGTLIRSLKRMFFDYRGHFNYEMKAGCAETLVSPLYRALEAHTDANGDPRVTFAFFHRFEKMTLTADEKNVESIDFTLQSEPTAASYDPFIPGTYQWPNTPRYNLLINGAALKAGTELEGGGYDLEDPRTAAPPFGARTYHWRGTNPNAQYVFDDVVLAIPPAATEQACDALTKHPNVGQRWHDMYADIGTTNSIPTQAAQLWFDRDDDGMGWERPGSGSDAALVGCYEQPFGNWADLSVTLDEENWPPGAVANIAYLCGPLVEDGVFKTWNPPAWRAEVAKNLDNWLPHAKELWPKLFVQNKFDVARVKARFHRANLSPSGRYVLSRKGKTKSRMAPEDSGFANLALAGDWTRNGADIGCVEATVMSGRQAARALLGLTPADLPVHGEVD
jgi:uncharacterized protein with NAD-binding domain and iron-sulfur cluster